MIGILRLVLAVLLWWGCWQSSVAAVPLKVVTTTSDLASLVTVVGGDRVSVSSIALPAQDPHTFEPRLTDVQQLRSAQLVVKIGLDHDLWLDRLTQESGNPALQRGGEGYVDVSTVIPLLEVRSVSLAPADGHNHGAGNPHYWLDPLNADAMTGIIAAALAQIDPESSKTYEANRLAFLATLEQKVAGWQRQLAPYQGVPLIAYHNSYPYLARRFRLKIIDFIEPRPGIPPSPSHLTKLLREMKDEHVPVVIQELYESDRVPRLLSTRTGAEVVTLVSSVGAIPEVPDYLSLFDYNVHALATALGRTKV